MKTSNSKTGLCVYCGKVKPLTRDHVPPKNIFPKPRPSNLITVPSCEDCHSGNSQISLDDEYFRLMLTLRDDVADHEDVKKTLPTVMRSLTKPKKTGFKNALLQAMHKVDIRTPAGLYLGKKGAYDVNLERLDRVVARITKGLFYREISTHLPKNYEVAAYSESGLRDVSPADIAQLQKDIVQPLMTQKPKIIGNNVFSYRVLFTEEDPNVSAWLLLFYEKVAFICITLPSSI